MFIYVTTQLSIPQDNRCIPDWRIVEKKGFPHRVFCSYAGKPLSRPDVIIMMGIGAMKETKEILEKYPDVPLLVYHWDCYSWVWERPRTGEYDYDAYGDLLRKAVEIWVPSDITSWQANRWWNISFDRFRTVLSAAPLWGEGRETSDEKYLLCCLRELPDPMWEKFQFYCEKHKIPYKMPGHQLPYPEYQNLVLNCTGLVSHMNELSTGGLSLLEGYAHGKPVLLNGLKTHGGFDYFKNRANYFYGEKDFEKKLCNLFYDPPKVPRDCWDWVSERFSDFEMIRSMFSNMERRLGLVS